MVYSVDGSRNEILGTAFHLAVQVSVIFGCPDVGRISQIRSRSSPAL